MPRRTGKRFWPGTKGPWRLPKAVFGEVSSGTAAITEANQTLSSAGTVLVSGTAALTQDNQALSAAGGPIVTGTAALTQANQALAASGGPTVAGIAALIEQSQILVATGNVPLAPITGTFSKAQADFALAAYSPGGSPPPTRLSPISGGEWQQSDRVNEPRRDYGW